MAFSAACSKRQCHEGGARLNHSTKVTGAEKMAHQDTNESLLKRIEK